MEKQIQLPITKLSYSSLAQLLRNPLIFKMKEILGVYDTKMSVSGMIGRAAHETLKVYYGGSDEVIVPPDPVEARSIAMDYGLKYLVAANDDFINYGKTGTREAMLAGYTQAMKFYFDEEPAYKNILFVEKKWEAELKTLDGDTMPLPAVGRPDLVHQYSDNPEDVEIIDTKFVTSFTDHESEDYIKILQAEFMFHLLLAAEGIKAKRMLFREVKKTKNQDGSPQVRDWAIPFDHEPYHIIFYNLYRDVVKYLSSDPIFLPNLSDPFDGEHAGLIYAQGLINSDMSDVEVVHKVRDVAFQSKKFVSSRLDSEINKHLLPEERVKVKLAEFGIPVEPVETKVGPSITQYRFKVSAGIRMSTIKKHKDDIARALEANGEVRIIAPIPGTAFVGVEVENKEKTSVKFNKKHLVPNTLSIPIGMNVHGEAVLSPLEDMPHLLIAGAAGSGKSVLLHSIIDALTKQMTPESMKLVLIDPKRVELVAFAKKPHLLDGIVYEYEHALKSLMSLTDEMERRYKLLEKSSKRNIQEYNASRRDESRRLPYIVVVIDEFADFMIKSKMAEGKRKAASYGGRGKVWLANEIIKRGIEVSQSSEPRHKDELIAILEENDAKDELKRKDANVELLVVRLAQMARAAGIHLIIATQRPSVDVITGLIKANFPTRIALTTASATDSNVILGVPGAEKLAGKGDMLFQSPARRGLERLQSFKI